MNVKFVQMYGDIPYNANILECFFGIGEYCAYSQRVDIAMNMRILYIK